MTGGKAKVCKKSAPNGSARGEHLDRVFYKSAEAMTELPEGSVHLAVISPPYFNIKDYSLNGWQTAAHSKPQPRDIGGIDGYEEYLSRLLAVWRECERVLASNGKLCVNAPLMPVPKRAAGARHNRHIYDLQSGIQRSILGGTGLFLLDIYIWQRSNPSKKLMFGSYPYPRNFYAQNTAEFVAVYVKEGRPENKVSAEAKKASRLTQHEWVEFTRQIWNFPAPGRSDSAFGEHPAIMPEELARRCIRLYSFAGETVLDPFAGSGTTLRAAKNLGRRYVGYEIYRAYEKTIQRKLSIPAELLCGARR